MTLQELYPKMRAAMRQANGTFGLAFFTYDRKRARDKVHRTVYEHCRLRHHGKDEERDVVADNYVFFIDMDTNELRQAWRCLVTDVRINEKWYRITGI